MIEKEKTAILRIGEAYKIAIGMGKSLVVAYSGGKDSDVLLHLAVRSGVPFRAEHNHTTVDAPQTVRHIGEVFSRLTALGIANRINYPPEITDTDGKRVRATMWRLIVKNGMPPTRLIRYCCGFFKERRFENQHLLMGIRWAESASRSTRGLHEKIAKKVKDRIVFMDENDDNRRLQEICQTRNSIATNPIIDWTTDDIWRYIKENGLTTNPLYGQGFSRVGCIGCPMASEKQRQWEFAQFPKYKQIYLMAFEKMLAYSKKIERKCTWNTPENVFNWWMDLRYNPNQLTFENHDNGGEN